MATGVLPDIASQGEQNAEQPRPTDGMAGWEQVPQRQVVHRGDIIKGTVVSLDHEGMWVGIGSKSEGIVPQHEMRSVNANTGLNIKRGDEVFVYVLHPENEKGQVVLSIDRAQREQNWVQLQEKLTSGEIIEVTVNSYRKGGLLVTYMALRGFVPLSQLAPSSRAIVNTCQENGDLPLAGKAMRVKILELDKEKNRFILSEMVALRETQEKSKARFLLELKEGELRKGKVTSLHPFGAFVNLGPAEGLIPLSELSWQANVKLPDMIKIGDELEVYVLKVDKEANRIALSLKRTQSPPWENIADKYQVGQLVSARITKLVDFGAFVKVDEVIDGLIHISEMADRRITHPKEVVKKNDVLTVKIISVEVERHRLRLSLKQAQEETTNEMERLLK
ncbi:MAG: S1 RNA-binding domain-containing protein [Chloroflexi bacterium]|nr:S1 RNA-binding domain-containing protein [Chloroflexota bacterium]